MGILLRFFLWMRFAPREKLLRDFFLLILRRLIVVFSSEVPEGPVL